MSYYGKPEELDHLVAAPPFGMKTGVHHQTHGAEQLAAEPAVVAHRILVEPHFLAQLLGIKRPALDVAGVPGVLAKLRQAGHLLLHRELHVMSRNAFMIGNGFIIDEQAVRKI